MTRTPACDSRRKIALAALLAVGVWYPPPPVAAAVAPSPPADWSTYANTRYRFAACVPRGFHGQGEALNGDGQRFVTTDGAHWAVYGAGPAAHYPLDRAEIADIAGKGARTLYRAGRQDWLVASGIGPRGEFYVKRFFRDDAVISFELVYPAGRHARYAPLTAAMVRCFTIGRGPE